MTTLATLRTEVRNRLKEASADFYADADINSWLNYGYRDFARKTQWFEKIKAYDVVANQFIYNVPDDAIHIELVRWADQYFVRNRDIEEFFRFAGFADQSGDRPYVYTLNYPWDKKFRVFPIPSTTSASTTINGAHADSATTIALTDASSFPQRGRAIVGSEQILWYAKSGNNLTQVVRGDGFTTAAALSGGETIKYAPLEVYMTYLPPDATGSVDFRIRDADDEALVAYAVATAFRKRDRYKEADRHFDIYKAISDAALNERERKQRDRQWVIKDDDDWVGEIY